MIHLYEALWDLKNAAKTGSWMMVMGLIGGIFYFALVPPFDYAKVAYLSVTLLSALLPTIVSIQAVGKFIEYLADVFAKSKTDDPAP